MIVISRILTADDTDALANTDLSNIPALGQLDIFVASTQNDTLLTITGPGNEPIVRSQRIQQRTNGIPSLRDDIPFSLIVTQGGHYVVNVDIQTAATANLVAIYRPVNEL